jgi:hypothetical protein
MARADAEERARRRARLARGHCPVHDVSMNFVTDIGGHTAVWRCWQPGCGIRATSAKPVLAEAIPPAGVTLEPEFQDLVLAPGEPPEPPHYMTVLFVGLTERQKQALIAATRARLVGRPAAYRSLAARGFLTPRYEGPPGREILAGYDLTALGRQAGEWLARAAPGHGDAEEARSAPDTQRHSRRRSGDTS